MARARDLRELLYVMLDAQRQHGRLLRFIAKAHAQDDAAAAEALSAMTDELDHVADVLEDLVAKHRPPVPPTTAP